MKPYLRKQRNRVQSSYFKENNYFTCQSYSTVRSLDLPVSQNNPDNLTCSSRYAKTYPLINLILQIPSEFILPDNRLSLLFRSHKLIFERFHDVFVLR